MKTFDYIRLRAKARVQTRQFMFRYRVWLSDSLLMGWAHSWGAVTLPGQGPKGLQAGATPMVRSHGEPRPSSITWTESELRQAWGK